MTDYYDGAVQGIAFFQAQPHFYDRIFDEAHDEYSNLFRLTPLTREVFLLAIEDWEIWLRWGSAFQAGLIGPEPHGALPEDLARHEEIKLDLSIAMRTNEEVCVIREGAFEVAPFTTTTKGSLRALQVKWEEPKTKR